MLWRDRRESSNVEDARGESLGRGGSGQLGLLMLIGRLFGIKGILIALVVGAVLWTTGIVNPGRLLSDRTNGGAPAAAVSAEEQDQFNFVKVVLADTEDIWTAEFARHGIKYELPVLKVYRQGVRTGCGDASSVMGPFYCPEDRKVYLDLSFYNELARTF